MARPEKVRLGDLLIQQELITGEQLQFALEEQKRNGRRLGRVLVDAGFITEERMSASLAKQFDIPYINLRVHQLNLDVVRKLSESQARRFRALPLEERKGVLLVGMADPTDAAAVDELGQALKRTIDIAVVTEGQLLETIDRVYRRTEEIGGLARGLAEKAGAYVVDFGTAADSVGPEEMPAVNLLKALLGEAVQEKAAGIHFDLHGGNLQVRFRTEGHLQARAGAEGKTALGAVQCLKLMSGLDVSERRLPQDGHLSVHVDGQTVDVLISTLPIQGGESVMMRMVKKPGEPPLSLDGVGLPEGMAAGLREIISRGEGMVLVTGPAGGDNAAVLYAALAEVQAPERKIITVEGPVEYSVPGIAQLQVDYATGLDFQHALRAAMHQYPDVILLGETPDRETAEASLRAAMRGSLVLSSLHARDAAGALVSLADMGVPEYLVAVSMQAILAKRQLRRVCGGCGEPYAPSVDEQAWLKQAGVPRERWGELRRGRGCAQCGGTGYRGHITVYELLEMDQNLREVVAHGDSARLVHAAHAQLHGHTLLDHALAQMAQGYTTIAELRRMGAPGTK